MVAVLFAWLLLAASPAHAAPRKLLRGHVPEAVRKQLPVGRLNASQLMDFSIGLPLRNDAALATLLEQIYDPATTNYHKYLTPAQFAEKFGPTAEDYQALVDFAQSHGFTVTKKHSSRTLLTLRGSVNYIEKAFQVNLRTYAHPTENRTFFAPDTEPSLDIGIPVLDISGLDDYVIPQPMSLHLTPQDKLESPDAFTGSGPSGNFIGNDFRAAYAPGVSLTGAGQAVGLVEFDGYYAADIATYKNRASLPDVPVNPVLLNGVDGSAGTNNTEVALDIEMAIAMAPGLSQVIVYEGKIANDILSQMLADNSAKQLSASWSYGANSTTTNLFRQMAAQGQSFFNASGDRGAYSGHATSPADVPYITAVGGTTLSTISAGGKWVSEKVWNWFTTGQGKAASSGGISTIYPIPTWQSSISMATNGGSTNWRNVPDVALTADNIWVAYNNGHSGEIAGTSAASPLWAGFMALVNEQAAANGSAPVGFINPAIYSLGRGASYTALFHDVSTGNNTNATVSTNFFAVAGYDLCTGWGTPKAALIAALVPSAPVIAAQPANLVVPPGNNATFTVVAVGSAPLFYQWQFNGANVKQASNSSYTLTNAQAANEGVYSVVISNALGSVVSSNATLVVNFPPVITGQPQDQTVPQGASATFTVVASGNPAPTYQWQFNSTNITSATDASFTVTNAQLANQGSYSVLVSNRGGTVASSNAVLTVNSPPVFTSKPISRTVKPGGVAVLSAGVSGSTPLGYQWLFNGANLTGATNASLVFSGVQAAQAGSYWMIVTNNFGSATSAIATISVLGTPVSFLTGTGGPKYSNGQVTLQISGLTGQGPVIIESSTNLVNWTAIFTNASGFGQFQFTDPTAANNSFTFYRAITPAAQ